MAYCPNCNATLAEEAEDCDVCGTSFGADSWLPLEALPQSAPRVSISSLVFKLGLAALLLPLAGLVLAMIIMAIVPGCHCDEVAGCDGCGVNRFASVLLAGGYEASLMAVVFVFPAAALLSGLLDWVSRRKT